MRVVKGGFVTSDKSFSFSMKCGMGIFFLLDCCFYSNCDFPKHIVLFLLHEMPILYFFVNCET